MKRPSASLLLAWLLAGGQLLLKAQTPRHIGYTQPLRHRVALMPRSRRQRLVERLTPGILEAERPSENTAEGLQQTVALVLAELRFETIALPCHTLTFVEGYSGTACGAVGNCMFWVLDGTGRILLGPTHARDFTRLRSAHHGLPDLLFGAHYSSWQTGQAWFTFDGSVYRKSRCATDTEAGHQKPRREFETCEP